MPETALERVFFVCGLLAIVGLLAAIGWELHTKDPAPSSVGARAPTTASAPAAPTTTASSPQYTVPATGPASTSTSTSTSTAPATQSSSSTTSPEAGVALLRLTARADTWLSVHRESAAGPLLYEGTLSAGASKSFQGSAFRVRFGAAANVRAELNGRSLPLPGGTYSTTITHAGLGKRSG